MHSTWSRPFSFRAGQPKRQRAAPDVQPPHCAKRIFRACNGRTGRALSLLGGRTPSAKNLPSFGRCPHCRQPFRAGTQSPSWRASHALAQARSGRGREPRGAHLLPVVPDARAHGPRRGRRPAQKPRRAAGRAGSPAGPTRCLWCRTRGHTVPVVAGVPRGSPGPPRAGREPRRPRLVPVVPDGRAQSPRRRRRRRQPPAPATGSAVCRSGLARPFRAPRRTRSGALGAGGAWRRVVPGAVLLRRTAGFGRGQWFRTGGGDRAGRSAVRRDAAHAVQR
jgi:hypothetical protein